MCLRFILHLPLIFCRVGVWTLHFNYFLIRRVAVWTSYIAFSILRRMGCVSSARKKKALAPRNFQDASSQERQNENPKTRKGRKKKKEDVEQQYYTEREQQYEKFACNSRSNDRTAGKKSTNSTNVIVEPVKPNGKTRKPQLSSKSAKTSSNNNSNVLLGSHYGSEKFKKEADRASQNAVNLSGKKIHKGSPTPVKKLDDKAENVNMFAHINTSGRYQSCQVEPPQQPVKSLSSPKQKYTKESRIKDQYQHREIGEGNTTPQSKSRKINLNPQDITETKMNIKISERENKESANSLQLGNNLKSSVPLIDFIKGAYEKNEHAGSNSKKLDGSETHSIERIPIKDLGSRKLIDLQNNVKDHRYETNSNSFPLTPQNYVSNKNKIWHSEDSASFNDQPYRVDKVKDNGTSFFNQKKSISTHDDKFNKSIMNHPHVHDQKQYYSMPPLENNNFNQNDQPAFNRLLMPSHDEPIYMNQVENSLPGPTPFATKSFTSISNTHPEGESFNHNSQTTIDGSDLRGFSQHNSMHPVGNDLSASTNCNIYDAPENLHRIDPTMHAFVQLQNQNVYIDRAENYPEYPYYVNTSNTHESTDTCEQEQYYSMSPVANNLSVSKNYNEFVESLYQSEPSIHDRSIMQLQDQNLHINQSENCVQMSVASTASSLGNNAIQYNNMYSEANIDRRLLHPGFIIAHQRAQIKLMSQSANDLNTSHSLNMFTMPQNLLQTGKTIQEHSLDHAYQNYQLLTSDSIDVTNNFNKQAIPEHANQQIHKHLVDRLQKQSVPMVPEADPRPTISPTVIIRDVVDTDEPIIEDLDLEEDEKEAFEKLNRIKEKIEFFENEYNNFECAEDKSQAFYYIHESLLRNIDKLDDLDIDDSAALKNVRRQLIRHAYKIIDNLQTKYNNL